MNSFSADIGYKSIHHFGETLCGDHVAVAADKNGSLICVLADGLGSGVKASILSTLTSTIISTMLSEGIAFDECVATVAKTLPIVKEKGVAYSTFTVILLKDPGFAEIIQYENPDVIMLRDGDPVKLETENIVVEGKTMKYSKVQLQAGDQFIALSDGCPYAGPTNDYNMDWDLDAIAEYVQIASIAGYSSRTIATMLIDEIADLYNGNNRDDATSMIIKIKTKTPVNILFGPPEHREDTEKMLTEFFNSPGQHIICGGTSSEIAAQFLGEEIHTIAESGTASIPPISEIKGVDLVTEGYITMSKVLANAMDYLNMSDDYQEWSMQHDGASRICQILFEQATNVHFFVGQARNPAYQNPELPFSFSSKMAVVKQLAVCLKKIGKGVKVKCY